MFRSYIFIFCFLWCCAARAQDLSPVFKVNDDQEAGLLKMLKSNDVKQRERSLLKLSALYLYTKDRSKFSPDKSLSYAQQVGRLALEIADKKAINDARQLVFDSYLKKNNRLAATNLMQNTRDTNRIRMLLGLNRSYFYSNQDKNDSIEIALGYSKEALLLSERGQNNEYGLRAKLYLGMTYRWLEKYPEAEKELLEVEKRLKLAGAKNLHYVWNQLAWVNLYKNDWNRQLAYTQNSLRSMKASGDTAEISDCYYSLALMYRNTGKFQLSVDNYKLAMNADKANHGESLTSDLMLAAVISYSKMKKYQEGLLFLKNALKEYPPKTDRDEMSMDYSLAGLYKYLDQDALAESHLLNMIRLDKKNKFEDWSAYKAIGQFYVERFKYDKAYPYLKQIKARKEWYSMPWRAHWYFLLFKVDSAAGNYKEAIRDLMHNKALDDSVATQTKGRAIQELEIKYETEKKDNALKIKSQDLQLVTRQAQLDKAGFERDRLLLKLQDAAKAQQLRAGQLEAVKKDRDIKLKAQNIAILTKESSIQHNQLRQAMVMRNMIIGGAVLLLLLLLVSYNRYLIKTRSNRLLAEQQRAINAQNGALKSLVSEKDQLLLDKEWLLKEVHHRVKNNLHTIMSLLDSQSVYLEDEALEAIKGSKQRVYAMSLIHQKLYQSEQITSISMQVYIAELIDYLIDSFEAAKKVRFKVEVAPIDLNATQAVPVGLILNEAITNALKYAFPAGENGHITVTLEKVMDRIELSVADNGVGLPKDLEKKTANSLGIKLMKGLCRELNGTFALRGEKGTVVAVSFKLNDLLQKAHAFSRSNEQDHE